MRKRLNFAVLILCLFSVGINSGCKKTVDDAQPTDYDITNKIFRVHATTNADTPYSVAIQQQNPGNTTSMIQAEQSNGGDFNYGFTPQAGSTITVKVQADKAINCYVFYNGTNLGTVQMTADNTGKYKGELVKTIN